MMEFLSRIEQSAFSQWVLSANTIWAYPMILFMHTVGMALVAGISSAIDIRLLGFAPRVPVKPLERLYPLMWLGFAINLITGGTLLIADATTKLTNLDFYIKMGFVFGGVTLLVVIRNQVFRNPKVDEGSGLPVAKRLAFLSLVCWVGAVTCGRLLAYLGAVSGLPGLRHK
ncbi:MAG: hypothetical protein C5B51_31435 [Terriglobia bacterium]|nr:MAG: hypothetical protein C5B51_31435 [Terriglobia bacterium]